MKFIFYCNQVYPMHTLVDLFLTYEETFARTIKYYHLKLLKSYRQFVERHFANLVSLEQSQDSLSFSH